MKKLIPVLAFILLSWPMPTPAEYAIPSTNRIDWYPAGVDIVGGIPTTFSGTNTVSSLSTGSDNTSTINNAIAAASSNYVVQLPSGGPYPVSGSINMKSGVVLRGAKAVGEYGTSWLPASASSATTLSFSGSYPVLFDGGSKDSNWTPGVQSGYTITSGYTRGSTSLTVSGGSFTIGDYICVYQDDNSVWINPTTGHGSGTSGSTASWLGEDSSPPHAFAQYKKVTGVSGSILTIDPAIYLVTPDATGAKVRKQSMGIRMSGLENLRLNFNGHYRGIIIDFAANCWVKGVETYNAGANGAGSPHIWCEFSYACTFTKGYHHEGAGHDSGQNYGIELYHWNSRHLISDNIIRETRHSVAFEGGGSGCVVAYNYTDDNWESQQGSQTSIDNGQLSEDLMPNHGSHPFMNLFEGNFSSCAWGDYTQGSSSHITLFRNRLNMVRSSHPLSGTPHTWYALDIEYYNHYYQAVGNLLGNPSMSSGTVLANSAATGGTDGCQGGSQRPVMYRFGFTANCGVYSSPQPFNTATLHGNYDFVSDGVANWATTDHVLPISLYYTNGTKPAWFGDRAWPPVDIASTSWAAVDRTNLPAGHRYVFGTEPGAGSGDVTAPVVTITSPTSSSTWDNAASLTINLAGTASDAGGLSAITWSNDQGGNGTAAGLTSWTAAGIPLVIGDNLITVTARDTSNNTQTDTLLVSVTGGLSPVIKLLYSTNYFGEIPISTTTNKTYIVTNIGSGTLTGTAAASSPWSISGNANYALGTGDSTNITVVFTPGATLGYYSDLISFTGGGGSNAPAIARAYPVPASYSNMTAIDFLVEQPLTINAGGNYISQSVEVSGAPELGGRAVVGFTLTSTTNLSLSALVTAQTSGSDSFYIALDQEPTDPTNICDIIPVTSTAFAYRTVAQRGNGSAASPNWTNYVWTNVVAGTHKIVIRGREADCLLQAIIVNPISTAGSADLTPPSLTITNPTSGATYTANTTPLTIGGTANDNVGLSSLVWETDRGASGSSANPTNWTGNLALQTGTNILTVTAYDMSNNSTNRTLTIFYGDTNVYNTVIRPPFGVRPLP